VNSALLREGRFFYPVPAISIRQGATSLPYQDSGRAAPAAEAKKTCGIILDE
jgi:hypothetical protein